jgi:voltage-gated potassium channel
MFNPSACGTSPTMAPWRRWLNVVTFGADTRVGRMFDLVLLWLILGSTVAVILESVPAIADDWGPYLRAIEWAVTILFTIEYVLRLVSVRRPFGYVFSFFGIVDLLSVIPTYISLFVAGTQALAVIRVLRVLRVFRLMKLSQFIDESESLFQALAASIRKITVFLGSVGTIVVIMGALMYVVEGAEAGFDSIPRSIYWAIVTLTTVGYGDIAPETPLGQFIAALIMIAGYSIIAVPTGIVSVELAHAARDGVHGGKPCPDCATTGHESDAIFCRVCGRSLGTDTGLSQK